ncbi:unnamed protein product [Prunus armeniaca]
MLSFKINHFWSIYQSWVQTESDSKEAISCLNRSIPLGRWQLYSILCSIKNSCSTFRDCNWSWVPRTANLAADHLAKLAMSRMSFSIWVNGPPSSLIGILDKDGLPNPPIRSA